MPSVLFLYLDTFLYQPCTWLLPYDFSLDDYPKLNHYDL